MCDRFYDRVAYDRPIAVLTGPNTVSAGDQVALRMTSTCATDIRQAHQRGVQLPFQSRQFPASMRHAFGDHVARYAGIKNAQALPATEHLFGVMQLALGGPDR